MSIPPAGPAALLVALVGGTLAAFTLDRRARRGPPDQDAGGLWARLLVTTAAAGGALLFLSMTSRVVWDGWWRSRYHLLLDCRPEATRLDTFIALYLPVGLWALAGLVLARARPEGNADWGRSLVGAIGSPPGGRPRLWVLAATIPFLVPLLEAEGVGAGLAGLPAAAWSGALVVVLSLAGVALSRPAARAATPAVGSPAPNTPPPSELRPWPEAMRAVGIQSRKVVSWRPAAPPRPAQGAKEIEEALRHAGATDIAPQLVEAAAALLRAPREAPDRERPCLVLGPDHAGQVEVVAVLGGLIARWSREATLIVTPDDPVPFTRRLGKWVPTGVRVTSLQAPQPALEGDIWVVDAATLSSPLLGKLSGDPQTGRIGLVVWWDLHEWTGVRAANVWALSRRLHRLLRGRGPGNTRTLALARAAHDSAELSAFLQRLLPHTFHAGKDVHHVETGVARPLEVHLLESQEDYFRQDRGQRLRPSSRHPSFVAALASAEAGWPTTLEPASVVSEHERGEALSTTVESTHRTLSDALVDTPVEASVRIVEVTAANVLALGEMVAKGGRTAPHRRAHYLAATLPPNAYVSHALERFAEPDDVGPASRRLLGARPHPAVVQRHLLDALAELPDTRSGLLAAFLWKSDVVGATLEGLHKTDQLKRERVRFLDDEGVLREDHLYSSLVSRPTDATTPLDCVGPTPVTVRDRDATHQSARMKVDPERLIIQAYPLRVFLSGGQRYRVLDHGPAVTADALEVFCEKLDQPVATWRLHDSSVSGVQPTGPSRQVFGREGRGRGFQVAAAELTYREQVYGVHTVEYDFATGARRSRDAYYTHLGYAQDLTTSFRTRGLLIGFEPGPDKAVASVGLALRHVLPVHLGVEEDALGVVVVPSPVGRAAASGFSSRPTLAVVDLFPGGIGLVDAIADDHRFLLDLLERTHDWLAACTCAAQAGCERCILSPIGLSAGGHAEPDRGAAVELLARTTGRSRGESNDT